MSSGKNERSPLLGGGGVGGGGGSSSGPLTPEQRRALDTRDKQLAAVNEAILRFGTETRSLETATAKVGGDADTPAFRIALQRQKEVLARHTRTIMSQLRTIDDAQHASDAAAKKRVLDKFAEAFARYERQLKAVTAAEERHAVRRATGDDVDDGDGDARGLDDHVRRRVTMRLRADAWKHGDDKQQQQQQRQQQHQQQQQQLQLLGFEEISDADVDLVLLEERRDALLALEADVRALHGMHVDLKTMVEAQGEVLDEAEAATTSAVYNTAEGTTYIREAASHQSAYRRKLVCLVLVVLIIVAVIITLILLKVVWNKI